MKIRRDVAATVLAALLAACGGAGGPSTATTPPSGLTYSVNPAVYTVGTPITPNTPTSSGAAVASYSVSPALPPGLSLNNTTGVIGGTPTALTAQATYTVTATNSAGSATAILSITTVAVRGVSIFAICSPSDPDATNGSCLYPATCGTIFAETLVLDVTTAQVDFRMLVQINNTLLDNSSGGQINTNTAQIQSFELTYTGAALPPWAVAAAVTVPSAGSSCAVLRLIPVAYFPALLPPGAATTNIVVNVRGHGVLTSQDSFTTEWFQVPVVVCAGCLASSVACTPPAVLVTCPSAVAPGVAPGQTATPACATLQ